MSEFDYRKPFQTRDGRKARLLCDNLNHPQPVLVIITDAEGIETVEHYHKDGNYFEDKSGSNTWDLINIPEAPKTRKRLLRADELPGDFWIMHPNGVQSRLVEVVGERFDFGGCRPTMCIQELHTYEYRWHPDRKTDYDQCNSFEIEEVK